MKFRINIPICAKNRASSKTTTANKIDYDFIRVIPKTLSNSLTFNI